MRGHLTVGMQLTFPMFDHTLYHSVHLSLIHIYISHTLSYTHNILLEKLVTIKVQTKQIKNITGTLPLPSEGRRKKDILHIVKSTIIAA